VIAALDVAVSGNAVLISFLSIGPLVAALRGRPRVAVAVAGAALVLAVLLGFVDDMFASADHATRIGVVAVVSGFAIWMAYSRASLERARMRSSLIAEVGSVMSGALDFDVSLTELARLCSRRLCDWCFVFVREEDGSIRQLAAAHRNIDRQSQAWELLYRYPLDPDRPEGPAKVIRSGRPDLHAVVGDEVLRAIAYDEENLRMLQALELRSAMITPLVARGRILGAIAFASAESGRIFTRDDLALAEEVSARAAISLDNARLYMQLSSAEQELRTSHEQLQAILDGVADAVTVQDRSGGLIYANDAAAMQLGYDHADQLMSADPSVWIDRYEIVDAEGRPFPFDDLPGRRALRGEASEPAVVRYRNKETGDERWSQIKATAILGEDGEPAMAINVIEDVTEQRERELGQRFLAEASGVLASSLDVAETFPRVAELAARKFGDWCSIEVLDRDGSTRRLAFAHADPGRRPLAEELLRRYPVTSADYLRRPLVGPELIAHLDDGQVAALARDPEHHALLRQIRPRSSMTVPMSVRGRTLGAVSVITAESGHVLDEDDLLLAEELAGRCALALDNARLYEERSRIARTLQESLLPPLLPELPGLDVAARFRAAGEGIDVGGDFYDLFEVGENGWAVAIGDVCGKGTAAAAVTALARYTVRAAAMRSEGPSQILRLLNEALLRQRSDRRFCTVLFGHVSTNGNGLSFEFSSGGHPLPLLLRPDGGGELGSPGTLLGIVPDPALSDSRIGLEPGDALVLYTDGVTDAGAPARIWTAGELSDAVGPASGMRADEIADRMLTSVLDATAGEPRDDIAIIVLKVPEA
jgi:serine phosphatase RsbU (regulator of sigma subunit)/PAS domain-containing protein